MTVDLQDAALTLGGLNLMMTQTDPVTGARIHALGDEMKLGDGEAVIASIQSQLQDGDLERIDRFGNREATIPLVIDAPDLDAKGDALAQMAAALDAVCRFDGWTELVYTSSLAGAEPSVYEVTSATVSATFDDLHEIKAGCRYVTLTIHARPFARPDTEVTIDAPPVTGSTTTNVDSGSSTTGWSMLSTAPAPMKNLIDPDAWAADVNCFSTSGNSSTATGQFWGNSAFGDVYVRSAFMPVTAGETYHVDLQFHLATAVTHVMGALYRFYNAGGTQVGSSVVRSAGVSGTGWVSVGFTTVQVPAGATQMRIFPYNHYPSADSTNGGAWFRYASVRLLSEPTLGYFDGATTDTTAINYTWDATANQSTSTGTWTAPSLAVVSGAVKGTVYGRLAASIRRGNTGITGAAMATLPYMRLRGTATAATDGVVTIADSGTTVTPVSYSYNKATGAWEILLYQPAGFTTLDVTFTRGGAVSTTAGVFVAVDNIDITDNPFNTGKIQSRQVQIYGSQRTELSLAVLGLDAAGTTPVGLGEQTLIHTAAAGNDGRAKFLACRQTTSLAGTTDSTAVSGAYNTPGTVGSPTAFTFPASTLLNGNYLVMARVRCATVGSLEIAYRAFGIPTTGGQVNDPATGWKSAFATVVASGAIWPQINQATGSPLAPWAIIPLGMLRLPPADVEDAGANITIQVFRAATTFDLDEVFLLNDDAGQASILLTGLTSGSYSAVRVDAATVDDPQASAWLGVAGGTMIADPTRWIGEQHQATPGLLQVSTVTPGCTTSRVSAHYYPRYHTHVADLGV